MLLLEDNYAVDGPRPSKLRWRALVEQEKGYPMMRQSGCSEHYQQPVSLTSTQKDSNNKGYVLQKRSRRLLIRSFEILTPGETPPPQ